MSQNQTTWTKTAKEGFTENLETACKNTNTQTAPTSEETASFGDDVYVGKDINEMILTSDPNKPKPTLSPEEEQNIENAPSYWDTASNFYNNPPTPAAALGGYTNTIFALNNTAKNSKNDIAGVICGLVYENVESEEAKRDLSILSDQISNWIAVIPMSYLMVINWWYIMCYTKKYKRINFILILS